MENVEQRSARAARYEKMKMCVHEIITAKSGSILLRNLARGEQRCVQFRMEEISFAASNTTTAVSSTNSVD